MYKIKVTTHLSYDLTRRIDVIADELCCSSSELVQEAIESLVADYETDLDAGRKEPTVTCLDWDESQPSTRAFGS